MCLTTRAYPVLSDSFIAWVNFVLQILAAVQEIIPREWPSHYPINDGERFDFIVVGAGSGGAVVASRLSEDPSCRVLLIEAGGDPSLASVVPNLYQLLPHSEYDWDYRGYLEEGIGLAYPGGWVTRTRGKMLGGSSALNWLIYARGKPGDYDAWNEMASGWSWKDTLPYFKKLEGLNDSEVMNSANSYLHSTQGPVQVTRPKENWFSEINNDIIIDSLDQIGIPPVLEMNGLELQGASRTHYNFNNGRRYSTAEAYLKPIRDRPNLKVAKHTRADKILIDARTSTAYGVIVTDLKTGVSMNAFTNKEVIVSAGSYDSPKLLMLSGIGPKEHLEELGVPVLADLPVGKNLKDHAAVQIILKDKRGIDCRMLEKLSKNKKGSSVSVTGYFSITNQSLSRPEIQFFNIHYCANKSNLYRLCNWTINIDDQFCRSIYETNIENEINFMIIALMDAKSKGRVFLNSTNPQDDPVIELGSFRNKEDINLLAEAIKFLLRLEDTTYFRNNSGKVAQLKVTGCEGIEFKTEEYWRCYVKNTGFDFLHPVGTCAMGANGVVDEQLKVHKVRNLRVVDASVMPTTPSANTNVPTMMIAEKAADMIKEDHGLFF